MQLVGPIKSGTTLKNLVPPENILFGTSKLSIVVPLHIFGIVTGTKMGITVSWISAIIYQQLVAILNDI